MIGSGGREEAEGKVSTNENEYGLAAELRPEKKAFIESTDFICLAFSAKVSFYSPRDEFLIKIS